MLTRKSLGTSGIDSSKQSLSIFYIVIPNDQSRKEYVLNCYRTNTVMIRDEYGSSIKNVFITNEVIQNIEFPNKSNELGTCVVCSRVNKHSMPLIIGSLNLKSMYPTISGQDEFRMVKTENNNSAGIFGSSKRSQLNVHVTSGNDVEAQLNINIVGKNHNSKFSTFCRGMISLFSTKLFKITSNTKILFELNRENLENIRRIELENGKTAIIDEQNDYSMVVENNKMEFGKMSQSREKTLLGETTKEKVEKLIDLISQIQVSTPLGPSSIPINSPQLLQLRSELTVILSENTKNN